MRILPYECSLEEEGVEVCRRLRLAGLHAEADWVEGMVEGVAAIKQEANVLRAVEWEKTSEIRALCEEVEWYEEKYGARYPGV
jgi:hypothetical protein